MDPSVSLPDPGDFDRGHHNGHVPGLVTHQLHLYDPVDAPVDDPTLPGNGVLPLAPAAVTDLLTTPGFAPTPDLVDEQTRLLEQELRAHLDRLDHLGGSYCNLAHGRDAGPGEHGSSCNLTQQTDSTNRDGSYCNLTHTREDTDPRTCPTWCGDADLPRHGDGFDTTPETEVPHRGIEHTIPTTHGGQSLDHAGRAHITLQLEQDRDRTTGPVITLSIVIRGIEHTAWLTTAETTALHHTLNQMLEDITAQR